MGRNAERWVEGSVVGEERQRSGGGGRWPGVGGRGSTNERTTEKSFLRFGPTFILWLAIGVAACMYEYTALPFPNTSRAVSDPMASWPVSRWTRAPVSMHKAGYSFFIIQDPRRRSDTRSNHSCSRRRRRRGRAVKSYRLHRGQACITRPCRNRYPLVFVPDPCPSWVCLYAAGSWWGLVGR